MMTTIIKIMNITSLYQKETIVIYCTFLYKFYKKVLTTHLCSFLLFADIHTFIVKIRIMIILLVYVIQRTQN
jgi:hypothetical protein